MIFAVLFAAVALGLSTFAVFVALTTRGQLRRTEHTHPPVRRPEPADERRMNLGAPREVGERRLADLGPVARHRAPDEQRARRRDADDPQYRVLDEPPTEQIAAQRPTGPATVEHPAPRQLPRRPGGAPALPRPGQIDPNL